MIERVRAVGCLLEVREQVDRTEVADSNFRIVRVERDFGAEVRAVHDADMLLGRADIAWILERDPGMPGFKQHRQHLAPEVDGRHLLEKRQLAAGRLFFVTKIGVFKRLADLVVQVGAVRR